MAVLFKQPDQLAVLIESLDSSININTKRTLQQIAYDPTSKKSNNDIGIPIVFGRNLYSPPVIFRCSFDNDYTGNGFDGEIVLYCLSVNEPYVPGGSAYSINRLWQLYIDGEPVTKMSSIDPSTRYYIAGGSEWSYGESSPYLATTGRGSNFGEGRIDISYIPAHANWRDSVFYKLYGAGNYAYVKRNAKLDDLDLSGMDVLAVRYFYDRNVFKDQDPNLKVQYQRWPVVYDGSNSKTYPNTFGNNILELLTNENFGLGVPLSKINRANFFTASYPGGNGTASNPAAGFGMAAGVFDLESQPVYEIINALVEENPQQVFSLYNGQYNLTSQVDSGITITDDAIYGEMEIEYPDSTNIPTKIQAEYDSYETGTTVISIGTSNENVIKFRLKTPTNFTAAGAILSNHWNRLSTAKTINFIGDKTFQQFVLNDIILLDTSIYSGYVRIIKLELLDNYTYNVTLESVETGAVPNIVKDRNRIIPIGESGYRPPADEREFPPEDSPDQNPLPVVPPVVIPAPPPNVIVPPAPTKLTISGLESPYNFNTGAANEDWYLGSTSDGTTADINYDTNGIKTTFEIVGTNQGVYVNEYSLIYRRTDLTPPTAIIVAHDLHTNTTEKAENIVGGTGWSNGRETRYDFPDFFKNTNSNVRYITGASLGWTATTKPWADLQFTRQVHGGSVDPYFANDNDNNFVYNNGNYSGIYRQVRTVYTFDSNVALFSNNTGNFNYMSDDMKRSGVYRLHFAALYGPNLKTGVSRVEYIGSTSTYGDGRSILGPYLNQAETNFSNLGQTFSYVYAAPPSRSIT